MLEIDGVRVAFELYNTDQADRLSDRYLRVLDLATSRTLMAESADMVRLRHDLFQLRTFHRFIDRILLGYDEDYSADESPVRPAYESALEQVDSIIFERIRNG